MNDHEIDFFQEEARELLSEIEKSLLELEQSPDNEDLINEVYRNFHTIKGSGGMFGYERVVKIAHELETLYDKMRHKQIKCNQDITDLSFSAADCIDELIFSSDVKNNNEEEIINRIDQTLNYDRDSALDNEMINEYQISMTNKNQQKNKYIIRFTPHAEIFKRGLNIVAIFNELKGLGECEIDASIKNIPPLNGYAPECCYTSWNITLYTIEKKNRIDDVFMFASSFSEIEITEEHFVNTQESSPYKEQMKNYDNERNYVQQKMAKRNFTENVKVRSEKLDSLLNIAGEIVTLQSRFNQFTQRLNNNDNYITDEIVSINEQLYRLANNLRENTMDIRMISLSNTFQLFHRYVRDLSSELKKRVHLTTFGEETELDKQIIDILYDPLVHIIRNCIDHGIESEEERITHEKEAIGKINIEAQSLGGHVIITISDDGAGIDTEAIKDKAVENGYLKNTDTVDENYIQSLIFQPGLSTTNTATKVSGRGMGMDIIKTEIEKVRGSVEVSSKQYVGTSIKIKLPLSISIIDGLLFKVGQNHFVVNLSNVEECLEINEYFEEKIKKNELLDIRGQMIPVVDLCKFFKVDHIKQNDFQLILLSMDNRRIGVIVDEIVGNYQTVLKPLHTINNSVETITGSTILGDGNIAFILDVQELINLISTKKYKKGIEVNR